MRSLRSPGIALALTLTLLGCSNEEQKTPEHIAKEKAQTELAQARRDSVRAVVDSLSAVVESIDPEYMALFLPDSEWSKETKQGVEAFKKWYDMHGRGKENSYLVGSTVLNQFVWKHLAHRDTREMGNFPYTDNVNHLANMTELVLTQGGLDNKQVYEGIIGVLDARIEGLERAAQDSYPANSRSVGAAQATGRLEGLKYRIDEAREKATR